MLCGAPLTPRIVSAVDAKTADTAPQSQNSAAQTVRESNALRTIEIVTDRDETVEQFFARQKLVLIDNANSDGKPCGVEQIISGDAAKFFASYPLQNDQNFAPYRFGDYYQLDKPSLAVAALFADDLNWSNTMLILAPDETNAEDSLDKKARLVGRVFIKNRNNWRPDMDAELLKYIEPEAKTGQVN